MFRLLPRAAHKAHTRSKNAQAHRLRHRRAGLKRQVKSHSSSTTNIHDVRDAAYGRFVSTAGALTHGRGHTSPPRAHHAPRSRHAHMLFVGPRGSRAARPRTRSARTRPEADVRGPRDGTTAVDEAVKQRKSTERRVHERAAAQAAPAAKGGPRQRRRTVRAAVATAVLGGRAQSAASNARASSAAPRSSCVVTGSSRARLAHLRAAPRSRSSRWHLAIISRLRT